MSERTLAKAEVGRAGAKTARGGARLGGILVALGAALGLVEAAAAAPRVVVKPARVTAGAPLLVRVSGLPQEAGAPRGRIGEHDFELFPTPTGFEALVSIPVDQAGGRTRVLVTPRGAPQPLEAPVTITATERTTVALEVDPAFVDPPPEARTKIDDDERALARAFRQPFGPPTTSRAFVWPRPKRVTAAFGDVRLFNDKLESDHLGIDLAGAEGAPVRAANDGAVVLARELYFSGKTVILHHGAGVFTTYLHLSEIDVAEGDEVARGSSLGAVGATGRTTAPHLHFAVRVDGAYVDPLAFMRLGWRPTADKGEVPKRTELQGRAPSRTRRASRE